MWTVLSKPSCATLGTCRQCNEPSPVRARTSFAHCHPHPPSATSRTAHSDAREEQTCKGQKYSGQNPSKAVILGGVRRDAVKKESPTDQDDANRATDLPQLPGPFEDGVLKHESSNVHGERPAVLGRSAPPCCWTARRHGTV